MKARAGIFCMVNKELIFDISEIEYLGDTGYIKYPFSHHEMWDKLKPDDVIGDYDAFPRGNSSLILLERNISCMRIKR